MNILFENRKKKVLKKVLYFGILYERFRTKVEVYKFFYVLNGVARTLKKLQTSKGDYWIQAMVLFNCVPFQNGNFS